MSDDGSEDSPPRPKRKIKRVVVMSSNSSSDSDESIAPTGTRRKRMRVVSDAESDSSGSSVVCAGTRRKRTLPKLRDSDGDSDTSGWATDNSDAPKPAPAPAKPASGFASDSSEGNSDKCSICLMRFTTQEVGTPQNCEHIFCLDCITEWSKNVNTCPVDRLTFDSIIVRTCAGGRVLRTEPVKVVERRPSVDLLVVEDPTVCEICGNSDREESMLLCDGCDLGFHMQCLTPPLTEIPADQWLCPNCDNILDVIHLSEVEDLFSGLVDIDLPLLPRPTPLRQPRNVRRSSRNISPDEPSTSTGQRGGSASGDAAPSTSRGSRVGRATGSGAGAARRRATGPQRRKYKRRRTKTVIIEYEVEENGKFPVTRRVKRRLKKRRTKKRQPRTAARRSYVRASVRAKLANLGTEPRDERAQVAHTSGGVQALSASRRRAGIPALSLFGSRDQIEFFDEDDERDASEGASTAVAVRPTASILSAYRQARRKMVAIPSPPHATAAPDILSSILDSQAKLHSKNSVVSISVDGSVNIKVQTRSDDRPPRGAGNEKKSDRTAEDDRQLNLNGGKEKKLDLSKGDESAARKAPSYPGQSRGGGWGGGYRGGYPRDQPGGGLGGRGHSADNGYQGGYGYQSRAGQQGGQPNSFNGAGMRRDDDGYAGFPRRQYSYPPSDDGDFDRNRRPPPGDPNRAQNFPPNRRLDDQRPGRHSLGPSWQPYGGAAPAGPRRDCPPARHSFGGSENPLDMRMGQLPPPSAPDAHPASDAFPAGRAADEPRPYRPLPEPPVFKFDKTPEVDKSEDERSDSGLVIDTEKYDPTEPTNDDDSGDEAATGAELASGGGPVAAAGPPAPAVPAVAVAPAPAPAEPQARASVVRNIIAGMDAGALNVPANVLDTAVRQVLREHRDLIAPAAPARDPSDDDSDGDCPNFSIYSATSVHIANDSGLAVDEPPAAPRDDMADLVQEDDDEPPPAAPAPPATPAPPAAPPRTSDAGGKRKTEDELKEKVSKRCPITTNPRNPIKIKLNTPSLIKRHKNLYDEDEPADDAEPPAGTDSTDESPKKNSSEKGSGESIRSDAAEKPSDRKLESTESVKPEEEKESPGTPENKPTDPPEDEEPVEEPAPAAPAEAPASKPASDGEEDEDDNDDKDGDKTPRIATTEEASDEEKIDEDIERPEKRDSSGSDGDEKPEDDAQTEDGNDDISDGEFPPNSRDSDGKNEDTIEKMTESISETEDERSYTPCLDENKSKDTSLETEKEKGIEGLDTEMISEDEGNEMFSDEEARAQRSPSRSPSPALSPAPARAAAPAPAAPEDGEILDKRRDKPERDDAGKKKKRKDSKRDSKKEGKEKRKGKKGEIAFKKLSKSGKERNYRDKDKDKDKEDRPRRDSSAERKRKRKEKRKDLERYDVRTVVTEKRRRVKDPFGRDVSPRRSRSASPERSPPPDRSPSPPRGKRSRSRVRRSASRAHRSGSRPRRSMSRVRRSISRVRRSVSRIRRSISRQSVPRRRRSRSGSRVRRTPSPVRGRVSPRRAGPSPSPPRRRVSSSPPLRRARVSLSPRSPSPRRRRRSGSRARRRASGTRARKRRASGSRSGSRAKSKGKRRRRARSERPPHAAHAGHAPYATHAAHAAHAPRRSPKRRRARRRSPAREPEPPVAPAAWSPVWGTPGGSVDSRLLSPRTPPPAPEPRTPRRRHRRAPPAPQASKEVFTSGDNILVSVSFKDQERNRGGSPERRERRERRRERRRRRKADAEPAETAARPVAIIDLERSPFRELTPSPRNVIVLSDSEHGADAAAADPAPPAPAPPAPGPRTPDPAPAAAPAPPAAQPDKPHRAAAAPASSSAPTEGGGGGEARGPLTPPEPPSSPDAYDPFEPTRSASGSPHAAHPAHSTHSTHNTHGAAPAPAPLASMTLEAAQKTNMSADDVIDRRPLSPMEKVMALLQSTRDVSPEPPPGDAACGPAASPPPAAAPAPAAPAAPPAPRIVLPDAPRQAPPKLFLAKPSPIKSDPIKPMQARPVRRAESEAGGSSPYSPGSSDFGELFEPPAPAHAHNSHAHNAHGTHATGHNAHKHKRADLFDALVDKHSRPRASHPAKVPVKLNKKRGKTQVGVKIDEDNLKILDDLPSSAVEMQVKSKFLKKLNRQERVVEEVKLVLKPHYNKKRVTKDEYKDILRRAVPKICHNKSGEINPTKIQALVEAYVKKFRKKHKLGLA